MSNIAIIFAGGSGMRMGAGLPKQFLEVNGKPIIVHTLEIFENHPAIDSIYVACKEDYMHRMEKYVQFYMLSKIRKVVPGSSTGQGSIYNALSAAATENDGKSIVLIHDGVRPCISFETIDENLACVKQFGNAVTCSAMYETPIVGTASMEVKDLPDRRCFYTAQAPQSFMLNEVIAAHEAERSTNPDYIGVIDTCTLMKKAGHNIHIVIGPRGNIKVTTPEDLFTFKGMLEYRETRNALGLSSVDVTDCLKV